jgi:hypothetical protein
MALLQREAEILRHDAGLSYPPRALRRRFRAESGAWAKSTAQTPAGCGTLHLETIARFVERAQHSAFCRLLLQYVIDRAKPEQRSATQLSEDR